MESAYRFTFGDAASNTYLTTDKGESRFTFDWSYDSIYLLFYNSGWITINLSTLDGLYLIDTPEKQELSIKLIGETLEKTRYKSWEIIKKAKIKLSMILDKLKSIQEFSYKVALNKVKKLLYHPDRLLGQKHIRSFSDEYC